MREPWTFPPWQQLHPRRQRPQRASRTLPPWARPQTAQAAPQPPKQSTQSRTHGPPLPQSAHSPRCHLAVVGRHPTRPCVVTQIDWTKAQGPQTAHCFLPSRQPTRRSSWVTRPRLRDQPGRGPHPPWWGEQRPWEMTAPTAGAWPAEWRRSSCLHLTRGRSCWGYSAKPRSRPREQHGRTGTPHHRPTGSVWQMPPWPVEGLVGTAAEPGQQWAEGQRRAAWPQQQRHRERKRSRSQLPPAPPHPLTTGPAEAGSASP